MAQTNMNKNLKNKVLFQKLGTTWYIFSQINNEMIYSIMPDGMDPRTTNLELYEVIEEHLQSISKRTKKSQLEITE
jgi:hypothetical protein